MVFLCTGGAEVVITQWHLCCYCFAVKALMFNGKDYPNMPQFLPIFDYIAPVKRFAVSCHCVSVRPRPVVVVATVA